MAELKLVLANPKTGKCKQKVLEGDARKPFFGKKIGEVLKGEIIDLTGYELKITGGSDSSGFPMRYDVNGGTKKKILSFASIGIKNIRKRPNPKNKGTRRMNGMRLRKTVAGNTVYEETAQLNLVITKEGKEPLDKPLEPEGGKEPAEEKKEIHKEAPKEEFEVEEESAENKKEASKEVPKEESKTDVKEEAPPNSSVEEKKEGNPSEKNVRKSDEEKKSE